MAIVPLDGGAADERRKSRQVDELDAVYIRLSHTTKIVIYLQEITHIMNDPLNPSLDGFLDRYDGFNDFGALMSGIHPQVQPLEDRILVEADPAEAISKGGLHIPEAAQEKPLRGRVIATGPGKVTNAGVLVSMELKAGDTILYGRYSGTELKVADKDYLIMRESDVYAVLN